MSKTRIGQSLVTGFLALLAAAVVVATVSAAPDARAPRIVSAAMQDADGDSRADRLRLVYSERIRHPVDKDGRYPFAIAGYKIRSVGSAQQKTIVLTLVEKQTADGAARPAIAYRRTKSKAIKDRAGNQARAQVFRAVRAHGKRPVQQPTPPPPPPPPASDSDGDGVIDADDCAPQDPAINPGAADAPDLAFVDSNCDGIDGDEQKAIFVSPLGNDNNPGTKAAPKREIQAAITAAKAAGKHVYAAAGSYARAVAATGVSVYGGYAPENWARSIDRVTTISGAPEGLYGDKATGVLLQHLTVRGASTGEPGASAYGIRLVNGSSVTVQRVVVVAGDGTPGADGAIGAPGEPGKRGGFGEQGSCDSGDHGDGGYGGTSPAGDYRRGGAGGRGGYGGKGTDGETVNGAIGGIGGASGDPGKDGQRGGNGVSGSLGLNGVPGSNSAVGATAVWAGEPGKVGTAGGSGTGGGGGGGGGGQTGIFVDDGRGNGGGGGGGGGNGGGPGHGGSAAGGSFGVYLHDSALISANSNSITAGNGGRGGVGGSGGPGGSGGAGEQGAYYCSNEIGEGGWGGFGGRGGFGGGGGGGAGGPSIGIFKAGTSTATTTGSSVSAGTAGLGGPGGAGASGPAQPGATGLRQAIYP